MTQPEADFRSVLGHYTLPEMLVLDQAIEEGKLIKGAYTDGQGSGCIMWHLGQIGSKCDLAAAFPGELYAAPRDLVRHFDDGRLTKPQIRRILREVIRDREALNQAEDQAIHRVADALKG